MERFLLINPFGIGDVLFTTAVIKAIKAGHPDAFVGYWCNIRVQGILKDNPDIDRVFALSRGDLKRIYNRSVSEGIWKLLSLLRQIKKERFSVLLDFSLDHRYSLIAKLLGIKRRIGFNYKKRGRFLTDKIDIEGYSSKHVVEYYLDLLKPLGIKSDTNSLYLNINGSEKIKSRGALRRLGIDTQQFLVGIAPGAGGSWGKDAGLKHWPAIKFAQLADKITSEFKAKIIILCDESERPIADVIVNTADSKPIDLAGKTTLEELAAMIGSLNLLITNDGGPLHMAVALGIKTVSIFGPVDDRVYGPYPRDNKHIVIKGGLSCQPCYQQFRMPLCDKDRECIKSIPVDEVFLAARSLIS
ncbi:MAG TPA: glycosyltransferase family 9 protein [Candidatus Omnitrophota bacterium]|nr:glycosyltransferase family 9 protein [Candidatus Omnitrophota bacterium]